MTTRGRLSLVRRILLSFWRLWGIVMNLLNCTIERISNNMDRQEILKYLKEHQSETPSKWREEAQWRRENRDWLRYSQRIAILLLFYMKKEGLTQAAMAERLGCTQQYVSKILKGSENLTIETIAKIERATNQKLMAFDA